MPNATPSTRAPSRSDVITAWAHIGELCRRTGDDCSWRAIMAGLCSRPIARLDKVWKRVHSDALRIVQVHSRNHLCKKWLLIDRLRRCFGDLHFDVLGLAGYNTEGVLRKMGQCQMRDGALSSVIGCDQYNAFCIALSKSSVINIRNILDIEGTPKRCSDGNQRHAQAKCCKHPTQLRY